MSDLVILKQEDALAGVELDAAFAHYRKKSSVDPENGFTAQFKKKEKLDGMAKSVLKHRIQKLTGRNMPDIEKALGYDLMKHGAGMPVENMRRLAQILILAAERPESIPRAPMETDLSASPSKGKKRSAAQREQDDEEDEEFQDAAPQPSVSVKKARRSVAVMPTPEPAKTTRRGRPSLAPAAMTPQPSPSTSKRASSRRSLAPNVLLNGSKDEFTECRLKAAEKQKVPPKAIDEDEEEDEETETEEEMDKTLGLDNPTPAMLAIKRRSLAVLNGKPRTPLKKVAARPVEEPMEVDERKKAVPAKKVKTPSPVTKKPVVAMKPYFPGEEGCRNHLVSIPGGLEDPTLLSFKSVKGIIPEFKGAHFTMIHTPIKWGPMDLFKSVQAVRSLNREAGLSEYVVLTGCGLGNVKDFHTALREQTAHVQLLVFECKNANLRREDEADDGKLRETANLFLLAYFFEGCKNEESQLPARMVREGATTVFVTENAEDLENAMINAFSVQDDWILDLWCRGRELTLAAQKAGRNAIAVDDDENRFADLKMKAKAIAQHVDPTFIDAPIRRI